MRVLQTYSDFIQKHVGTRGTPYIPPSPRTHTQSESLYKNALVPVVPMVPIIYWYPLVPVRVLQTYSVFIQKHVGTRGTHYIPPPPHTHSVGEFILKRVDTHGIHYLLVPIGTHESTADI